MENQEKIQILKDIVAIKSVNGNEKEVAEYLSKLFKKHGIDSSFLEYDKERDNLIVEIGNKNSEKVLAFSGHMDVVSAGNESDWTSDPFKPEIRDGKMYGRGTCDMKSGLAAMVSFFDLNGKISFDLFGTIDECPSVNSRSSKCNMSLCHLSI